MEKSSLNQDELQKKVQDFQRFGQVLLSLSFFWFLGVIIPQAGKTALQIDVLMVLTVVFIVASFYFFKRSFQINDLIIENEEG